MKKIKINAMSRAFLFSFAIVLILASCKKSITDVSPAGEDKQSAVSKISAVTRVDANASATFNSFNSSFLVTSGSTQYYKDQFNIIKKQSFEF